MDNVEQPRCTAFVGFRRVAAGDYGSVALEAKKLLEDDERASVLIFDDATGAQVDFDLRGTTDEILRRLAPAEEAPRGPGRPKLGVVAREVTLLPRHWDWLNAQPGGASVALRKLVDEARKTHEAADRTRRSREAAYRFMSAVAGNLPGFEEATRALFAGDEHRLAEQIRDWPEDVRDHAALLASA